MAPAAPVAKSSIPPLIVPLMARPIWDKMPPFFVNELSGSVRVENISDVVYSFNIFENWVKVFSKIISFIYTVTFIYKSRGGS
jgi:hypothetical protein